MKKHQISNVAYIIYIYIVAAPTVYLSGWYDKAIKTNDFISSNFDQKLNLKTNVKQLKHEK